MEAKSGLRLVSYHDDTVISDDENASPESEVIFPMDLAEEETEQEQESNSNDKEPFEDKERRDRFAEYGFALPPEPKGKCPQELQDKITNMYDKMKANNMDMNKLIQERKEFRNPSIYEKLIQYCAINELGTNYPPELYDPEQWDGKLSSNIIVLYIHCKYFFFY